jgi:plasmid maintenance system antidote protein VapI
MRAISECKPGTSRQRHQSTGEYLMETIRKAKPKTYKTFAELLENERKKIESSTDQS